jgi:hypothetical protein
MSTTMKLVEWIKNTNTSLSALSDLSGVPLTTLHRIVRNGKATAEPAIAIWKATGCQIDLLGLLYPDQKFKLSIAGVHNEKTLVCQDSTVVVSDSEIHKAETS